MLHEQEEDPGSSSNSEIDDSNVGSVLAQQQPARTFEKHIPQRLIDRSEYLQLLQQQHAESGEAEAEGADAAVPLMLPAGAEEDFFDSWLQLAHTSQGCTPTRVMDLEDVLKGLRVRPLSMLTTAPSTTKNISLRSANISLRSANNGMAA